MAPVQAAPIQAAPVQSPATVVYMAQPSFGNMPTKCVCPQCSATVITGVRYRTGALAWILCILCLLFGCWMGCCLIPLMMEEFQDIYHVCPNCHGVIGRCGRL
ncbi:hypothetical protein M3Y94_00605600 [Aphelenchoides besseyi]|nr:hypothetical protein M3Y94_00605600 [Aphelenchoides besseyi]